MTREKGALGYRAGPARMSVRPPELLSPAGNWDCARAAVANGADAIYFGLPGFNARLRADNFSAGELPELMAFLHRHGVKGYLAFNTLVFTSELANAEKQLRLAEEAGVDAVIVQDLGLARMVKAITPRLRLHTSTQMTITSPEGLEFAKRLGIDQAVLARELSLRELERFDAGRHPDVPLEVFVHGALCVAYSGQCLTSESLGRRSANRGECAQACRMTYEMVVDGETRALGDRRYLLSPQDLAAVNEIPRLIELGIRSFKIEGRLKTPEYVAAVTSVYRKAIDVAVAKNAPHSDERPDTGGTAVVNPIPSEDWYALEMTFSRGLYTGWLQGVNHQELVPAHFGTKRGPLVGRVRHADGACVEIEPTGVPLKPGDGVVFENAADTDHEQGGRLYAVHGNRLEFQHGKIQPREIPAGTRVFKTSDPALDRRLRRTFEGEIPVRKQQGLDLIVRGRSGEPLVVVCGGLEIRSAIPLQPALNRPLTEGVVREQLGRLGGTPYQIRAVRVELDGSLMLPVSELNRMRRALVERLVSDGVPEAAARSPTTVADLLNRVAATRAAVGSDGASALFVLCRSFEQIEAALQAGIERIYADFEDMRRYADVVGRVKDHGGSQVFLATPRIQKPGEAGFFKLIERAGPDGILVRNLGAIACFSGSGFRLTGDFSLNVANPLTAAVLVEAGLERLAISYDLNIEQVTELLRAAPPEWFELTVHQHMPMFHMEHCAFAAFLSGGTDFTNCGRPCEKHRVKLRDRAGMEHPLKADVGCRNTLFNAVPQTGARFFPALRTAGLRHYRIELLEETGGEAARTIRLYQELLAGRRTGDEVWAQLRAQSQLGVTRGTWAELS